MLNPLGSVPSNRLKRGRVDEPSDAQRGYPQVAKRQKREQTPPAFWDNISRVPLCRRALREFERRSRDTTPPERPQWTELQAGLKKRLKRFARHGGPDCQDIITYPAKHESPHAAEMSSRTSRSSGSRRGSSSRKPSTAAPTKLTTITSKDSAFAQRLVDYKILTEEEEDDGIKCDNFELIMDRIRRERSSMSPSHFPRAKFVEFKKKNREAKSEDDVKEAVMPMIRGSHHRVSNRRFTNLASMTAGETRVPQPDYYEGSRPSELERRVRQDLSKYIIPSGHDSEPLLPNHFTEVKGPVGNAEQMRLQATYDAAHGSRAMHRILSYGQEEQQYDGHARSFASTYHSGTRTLQLYASHATEPSDAAGDPSYHITELRSFALTDNYDTHRAGLTAYRNIQDLAKEERDNAIAYANGVARSDVLETLVESPGTSFATTGDGTLISFMATSSSQVESDNTSTDELARDFNPPAKRTSRSSKPTASSKRSRTTATANSEN